MIDSIKEQNSLSDTNKKASLLVSPTDHSVCCDMSTENLFHCLTDLAQGTTSASADDRQAELKHKLSLGQVYNISIKTLTITFLFLEGEKRIIQKGVAERFIGLLT